MQSTPRVRRAAPRISCINLSSTRVLSSGAEAERGATPRCSTAKRSCAERTNTATPSSRPAVGDRKQRLHPVDVADPDAQAALLLVDLRDAIGVDRLLDARPDTVLIDVEEQQLFECRALLDRQFARDAN